MQGVTDVAITPAEFTKFRQLIYGVAGIYLSDAKQALLVGRLGKRLRQLGLGSYGQYLDHLSGPGGRQEMQIMIDLMTTNETYFFREEKHFDYLRTLLATWPAGQPFNVWSAACSTGEEVYTLCMVLADELGADGNWTVTGSDISQSVLQVARNGQYSIARTRGLPQEYLRKYCLKGVREQDGTFIVDRRLRSHTRFLQFNLKDALPEIGPFDVVFLRNVMIYFDAETKRHVASSLVRKIRPGGLFVVGHSETLNGIVEGLALVQPTIYRKP